MSVAARHTSTATPEPAIIAMSPSSTTTDRRLWHQVAPRSQLVNVRATPVRDEQEADRHTGESARRRRLAIRRGAADAEKRAASPVRPRGTKCPLRHDARSECGAACRRMTGR